MKSITHEEAKPTAQRTVGQSVEQHWDCSQIEDRYEEEDLDWHEGDQMEEQLDEDVCWSRFWSGGEWTEVLGKRKPCKRNRSWQRMNACLNAKKVEGLEGKKKVKGWSMEEMKNKPSSSLVEDTEEMIGWRTMNQEEMDKILEEACRED